ncbi:unnamed protein product, partial [Closterium sp. NIES-54]
PTTLCGQEFEPLVSSHPTHSPSHRELGYNSLTGSIPNNISALMALEYLNLWNNNLTGSIPNSISALTALTSLHLSYNQLTGSIPNSISALAALTEL